MALKAALHLPGRRHSPDVSNIALPPPLSSPGLAPSRSHSASRSPAEAEPDLAGREPRRMSSFGRSRGLQALASGNVLPAFTRRNGGTGSDGSKTPPAANQNVVPLSSTLSGPQGTMAPPITPDPSHLAHFSLRLSELVARAFQPCVSAVAAPSGAAAAAAGVVAARSSTAAPTAPPLSAISYDGHALPAAARVTELAQVVVTELRYAAALDDYLLRAVSRAALKALSLFASRIDALLVAPARDSGASFVPATAKDGASPPAALEYNLGLVVLLWTVDDALERCLEGDERTGEEPLPHFVAEILAPVRQRLERSILHIVQPLLVSLKLNLATSLANAVPAPFDQTHISDAAAPAGKPAQPAWVRDFEGRVEGTRRLLLPRLEARCGIDGEGWFVGVAVHVIWKGLLRLAAKPMPLPPALLDPSLNSPVRVDDAASKARNPTPAQLSSALKVVATVTRPRKRDESRASSGRATPAGVDGQVASSPSAVAQVAAAARASAAQAADLAAFERLMQRFAEGFTPASAHGKPDEDDLSDDSNADELARAALAEALQAIRSTAIVAAHLDANPRALLMSSGGGGSTLPPEVSRAARAIPSLLLLHLVYARMPRSPTFAQPGDAAPARVPSPPALFGLPYVEYVRAVGGFAGGETWAVACATGWADGIEDAWSAAKARVQQLTEAIAEEEAAESEGAANGAAEHANEAEVAASTPALSRQSSLVARSSSDSSAGEPNETPDFMTQSAPTLDGMRSVPEGGRPGSADSGATVGATTLAPASNLAARKRWALLRRTKLSTSEASDGAAPDTSRRNSSSADVSAAPSPDGSPSLKPTTPSLDVPSTPNTAPSTPGTAKRAPFWRSSSTGPNGSSARFTLTSVTAPLSRTASPRGYPRHADPASSSPNIEENSGPITALLAQLDGARRDLAALDLLARAAEQVAAARATPLVIRTPGAMTETLATPESEAPTAKTRPAPTRFAEQ